MDAIRQIRTRVMQHTSLSLCVFLSDLRSFQFMGREPICTWLDIKGGGLIRNTFVYNAILQDNLQLTREHS